MKKIRKAAAMVALFACAMPSGAFADHMCWVDHAQRAGDGVEVYFLPFARLYCNNCTIQPARGKGLAHAHIKLKQSISIEQTKDSSCVLTAKKERNVLGVFADSHMNIPGWVPNITNEFIPVTLK